MVGAVIVRNGEIIGRGYHRRFGGDHAEIEAISDAGEDISGATLYVTLEPCCHHGKKTPPCLDTLLKHDLGRVVIGTQDPNPKVNGRSVDILREWGIQTDVGVLSEECRHLNEVYFKYIVNGTPFVTLKFAQTLDGKIATLTGDSRWISSGLSLKYAHRLRSLHDAVLVGVGTVLKDNPELTVRMTRGRSPLRIVVDSSLRMPVDSRVLQEQGIARTVVATTPKGGGERLSALTQIGIETLIVDGDHDGRVDIMKLLKRLGDMNVSSVLVEGGAAISTSLLSQGLWDRLVVIIAPKIVGRGTDSIGDLRIREIENALKLRFIKSYRSGEDLIIEARAETALNLTD
jgi:diaminohydroxyphosphoribosylaminopyrimidine deaminase/5-amino-6-(5-phosphoribosylamino)uracil reductase